MKKLVYFLLVFVLISSLFGCSNENKNENASEKAGIDTGTSAGTSVTAKPVKIWWLLSGAENDAMLAVCKKFNESQTAYVAEGLSVDLEKTITAMSSNEGPDVIWLFTSGIAGYADQGLIENLDGYISKTNFDLSTFTESSIKASSYNRSLYAMPLNTSTCTLFYNKDLLEGAGYTEPPKTMDELYKMSVDTTKKKSDGDIDVMGFPLFDPFAYQQEGVYAFGGRYADDDGVYTPENKGILEALKMNVNYRQQIGMDAVNKYMANASTNVYTANDVFFKGQQTFRFDGPWMTAMIKSNAPDLDYGIALVPGSDGQAMGAGRIESAVLMMASTSKNKDGAFELMKFFTTGEAAKQLDLTVGWIPSDKSLYKDADIMAVPGYDTFIAQIESNNGVIFPMKANASEYSAIITEYFDMAYNGKLTPEDAIASLVKEVEKLK